MQRRRLAAASPRMLDVLRQVGDFPHRLIPVRLVNRWRVPALVAAVGVATPRKSRAKLTDDVWMGAAFRGSTAFTERGLLRRVAE
jgi:hypothetical protein